MSECGCVVRTGVAIVPTQPPKEHVAPKTDAVNKVMALTLTDAFCCICGQVLKSPHIQKQ